MTYYAMISNQKNDNDRYIHSTNKQAGFGLS